MFMSSTNRVNILTVLNEPNYGAQLQAYATYRAVESLGYEPRMIYLSMDFRSRAYSLRNRMLLPVYSWLKGYSHAFAKAKAFGRRHMPNQTRMFPTPAHLRQESWDASDTYLVGSDQVWNPSIVGGLLDSYCLGFLPDECSRRISYASSFGSARWREAIENKMDFDLMRRFRALGVREAFGCNLLADHGIEATEVIDPTLLQADYRHLIASGPISPDADATGHILFLCLSDVPEQQRFVDELSKRFGLPVKKVYGYLQPSAATNRRFLDVEDWLYAISTASVVVTDSFHASVFSIIFHRPFYVYISEPSKADRITNIFGRLGVPADRITADASTCSLDSRIDWDEVDARRAKEREHGLNFLMNALKKAEE